MQTPTHTKVNTSTASNATTQTPHNNHEAEHPRFKPWVKDYSSGMFETGIFGGSIVFSVLMSDLPDPIAHSSFSKDTVRIFLALAWGAFSLTLGSSWLFRVFYTDAALRNLRQFYNLPDTGETAAWALTRGIYAFFLMLISAMPIVAFVFLSLAVAAYVPVVGWIVLTGASLFLVVVVVMTARLIFQRGSLIDFGGPVTNDEAVKS